MDVDSYCRLTECCRTIGLQWSHVLMDVDRNALTYFSVHEWDASMEPRPDGRG